jgi:hypothetical protein
VSRDGLPLPRFLPCTSHCPQVLSRGHSVWVAPRTAHHIAGSRRQCISNITSKNENRRRQAWTRRPTIERPRGMQGKRESGRVIDRGGESPRPDCLVPMFWACRAEQIPGMYTLYPSPLVERFRPGQEWRVSRLSAGIRYRVSAPGLRAAGCRVILSKSSSASALPLERVIAMLVLINLMSPCLPGLEISQCNSENVQLLGTGSHLSVRCLEFSLNISIDI